MRIRSLPCQGQPVLFDTQCTLVTALGDHSRSTGPSSATSSHSNPPPLRRWSRGRNRRLAGGHRCASIELEVSVRRDLLDEEGPVAVLAEPERHDITGDENRDPALVGQERHAADIGPQESASRDPGSRSGSIVAAYVRVRNSSARSCTHRRQRTSACSPPAMLTGKYCQGDADVISRAISAPEGDCSSRSDVALFGHAQSVRVRKSAGQREPARIVGGCDTPGLRSVEDLHLGPHQRPGDGVADEPAQRADRLSIWRRRDSDLLPPGRSDGPRGGRRCRRQDPVRRLA